MGDLNEAKVAAESISTNLLKDGELVESTYTYCIRGRDSDVRREL